MAVLPFKPNEEFEGLRFGYPFEVIDSKTGTMVANDRGIPYASRGKMHYELCNDGDSAVLLYSAIEVFATEGDSGSLIIVEKDDKMYIAGHHAGTVVVQGYGVANANNV